MQSIVRWIKQPQNYIFLIALVVGVVIASRRYSLFAIVVVLIVAAFAGLLIKKVFYKE